MSSVNEIKSHLKAVEQTKQITNAMYLLSTSRMKKAMQNIDFNLLYLKRLRASIRNITEQTAGNGLHDKFTDGSPSGTAVFVVVTSDKGLCGNYNDAVVDLALEKMAEHKDPLVISLGIIGDGMFKNMGIPIGYSWYGASQHPTLNLAEQVASKLIPLYLTEDYHEVYVVFTEYINSAVQTPTCVRLLPFDVSDFSDISDEHEKLADMIYEPNIEKVFESLAEQYVVGFMYDVFMQSAASENIARMNAMQSATKNADDMIKELSTDLNAARQLQITNEITEISAAAQLNGV